MTQARSKLALFGGPKAVPETNPALFKWPIITAEDEQAVLDVLRAGAMSGTDITKNFEAEYAAWVGSRHALGYCNGTASLFGAFWGCGVGAGDDIICPAITYWASCTSVLGLGATVQFADIDPRTLCIDPADIEHRIGPRTRVIVVVHYGGHPCDMDPIMEIARRNGVKVVEDVSHAHGALYKGRQCGTIGDVAALSMMAGKGFAIGEAGMLLTDNRDIYERAIAFGHYERTGGPSRFAKAEAAVHGELARFRGLPIGGHKHRMNQTCSAMGRVQLKYFPERIAEIQRAMNRFWDLLEGVPGIRAHRPPRDSGSTMGCWYFPRGLYREEELGGLPCETFCEAVRAEGVEACSPGANFPLHPHPVFHEADLFHQGRPTAVAFGQRDTRQGLGALPVSERIAEITFGVPWFKHDQPEEIEKYAEAYRKVALQAEALMRHGKPASGAAAP
ncbi:MAG: DegT/DnrJ/EryC1/StrS family aminotransferase [Kiritimatiellia bacterium]|jgi:perosamine synthetase